MGNQEGLQIKYFVLKPKGKGIYAEASRKAMRAYANHIKSENPEMAKELRKWADREWNSATDRKQTRGDGRYMCNLAGKEVRDKLSPVIAAQQAEIAQLQADKERIGNNTLILMTDFAKLYHDARSKGQSTDLCNDASEYFTDYMKALASPPEALTPKTKDDDTV